MDWSHPCYFSLLFAQQNIINLKVVFKATYKLSSLSKLKCELPVLSRSNVVYLIKCGDCSEFYIGKTERRLSQRVKEHLTCENSALRRHELATDHKIDFDSVSVLACDNHPTRLLIKETLKIKEHCAVNSLNGNMGSFELRLFQVYSVHFVQLFLFPYQFCMIMYFVLL